MRRVAHRLVAVFAVLTLVLSVPAGLSQRCDRCPVQCPMHRTHGHVSGCHHGARAATEGGPMVGCACGHAPVTTLTPTVYGVLPTRARVGSTLPARRLATSSLQKRGRVAPEPPSEPPRPLV
jgi:hypothetical protein